MKKLFLSILMSVLAASSASAITLSITRSGAGTGIIAETSTGTLLSTGGYYFAAGTFSGALPTIDSAADLLAAVAATKFLEFGSTTAANAGGPIGTLTGSIVGNGTTVGPPATTAATFNGAPLYFLVGNAATRALSTEFAIFSVTANATFPADVTPGTLITVNIGQSTQIALYPGGKAGTVTDQGAGVSDRIKLASTVAIPEPSSLALFGLIGLVSLRRKR